MVGAIGFYVLARLVQEPIKVFSISASIYEFDASRPLDISAGRVSVGLDETIGYSVDAWTISNLDLLVKAGKITRVSSPSVRAVLGRSAEISTSSGLPTRRQTYSFRFTPRALATNQFELAIDAKQVVEGGARPLEVWRVRSRPVLDLATTCLVMTTFEDRGVKKRVLVVASFNQVSQEKGG